MYGLEKRHFIPLYHYFIIISLLEFGRVTEWVLQTASSALKSMCKDAQNMFLSLYTAE